MSKDEVTLEEVLERFSYHPLILKEFVEYL